MRILGIDPGFTRLGVAVLSVEGGVSKLENVACIFHPPREQGVKFNEHLNKGIQQLVNDFPKVIDMARPNFIAAETVPAGRLGSNSELVVAAVTVCKTIAFQFGIEWKDIAANTIKKTVTGNDIATKATVKRAVFAQFPSLEEQHKKIRKDEKKAGTTVVGLPQDVFDAVAIALTGAKLREGEE
jgi:Holliday junction resolvasome RuvABC endonuclease subunit